MSCWTRSFETSTEVRKYSYVDLVLSIADGVEKGVDLDKGEQVGKNVEVDEG